ncbi:Potassium voltage-gated channel protein Shal [Apis cerana cerana]|uniref:Potassium voltage-gated channel protein Shal n=1 Tax=Apis cerana cerana TaxID=94128 RepID=A0A2A3EDW3_APICC|nr:Potassium voltage-gated channel protein Shal [Apis cerana cerana]
MSLHNNKARLARIRIAKASSGAAFVSKKKAAEARLAAQESGLQLDDNYKEEDIFELQHHHLLRCLEKTTPAQSHYQPVDPTTVPNVAFNVPGDSDRQRRQGTTSSSPYNETRVDIPHEIVQTELS